MRTIIVMQHGKIVEQGPVEQIFLDRATRGIGFLPFQLWKTWEKSMPRKVLLITADQFRFDHLGCTWHLSNQLQI